MSHYYWYLLFLYIIIVIATYATRFSFNTNRFQLYLVSIKNDKNFIISNVIIDFFLSTGAGRFFDPRTKQSFKYDHLRKEASDFQTCEPDPVAEPWRSALDVEAIQYTGNHYRHGMCSVFGRNDPSTNQVTLSLCIEDHQFQPQNYWNGRWRSQWSFTFSNSGTGAAEIKGVLKVQVCLACFCSDNKIII